MTNRIRWTIAIIGALLAAQADAEPPTVEVVAQDSAPHVVYVDGVEASSHAALYKAVQSAVNHAFANPDLSVQIRRDATWRVDVYVPEQTGDTTDGNTGTDAGLSIPDGANVIEVEDGTIDVQSGTVDVPNVYRSAYPDRRAKVRSIDTTASHVWLVGLQIADERDAKGLWLSDSSDVTIADCLIANHNRTNVKILGGSNVRMVGNIIRDAHTTGDHHVQGAYLRNIDGLTIERNVVDRNGWHPDVEGADRNMFRHGVYMTHCNQVRVRENVFIDNSAQGLKIASKEADGCKDVIVERNVFHGGWLGATFGWGGSGANLSHRNMTVRHNVFHDTGRTVFTAKSAADVVFSANLVVESSDRPSASPVVDFNPDRPHENLTIRNNVIHQSPMRDWNVENTIRAPDGMTVEGNRLNEADDAYPDASVRPSDSFYAQGREQGTIPDVRSEVERVLAGFGIGDG